MEILFKCIIEVTRHGVKKNGKQIFKNRATGQRFIASNSKSKHLENLLNAYLLREKLKARLDTIDCDINACMIFYYPESVYFTKAGKRSNKVADLSNLYESVQDAMQKVGIIRNDSLICGHDGSKRLPISDNKYFLKIELTKVVE